MLIQKVGIKTAPWMNSVLGTAHSAGQMWHSRVRLHETLDNDRTQPSEAFAPQRHFCLGSDSLSFRRGEGSGGGT